MPNNISLAKNYTDLLDEVYKKESVTADLISDSSMMRAGANANEILYPQIDVTGLGNYSRNSGYTDGSVTVEWKTATGTYENAAEFLAALLVAKNKMDEDEVPEENRLLYATPTLINGIMALDTYKSREVINTFAKVRKVPQSRFYTKIKLLDGKSAGEEIGHYKKASDGLNINFMIIHKPAIIKFDKHVVSSVISPDMNPNADAYIAKYRKYGLVDELYSY